MNQSVASGHGKASGTRKERTKTPIMQTPAGPAPVDKQVTIESKLNRSAEGEQIMRHIITSERQPDDSHQRIELAGQTMYFNRNLISYILYFLFIY